MAPGDGLLPGGDPNVVGNDGIFDVVMMPNPDVPRLLPNDPARTPQEPSDITINFDLSTITIVLMVICALLASIFIMTMVIVCQNCC